MPTIQKVVTLEQVANDAAKDMIFYSSRTVWWTDDREDLQSKPGVSIPLDIFGAPLLEGPKADFLKAALSKPEFYGNQGFNAFMAAHHKNFKPVVGEVPKDTYTDYKAINQAVGRMIAADPKFTLLK